MEKKKLVQSCRGFPFQRLQTGLLIVSKALGCQVENSRGSDRRDRQGWSWWAVYHKQIEPSVVWRLESPMT